MAVSRQRQRRRHQCGAKRSVALHQRGTERLGKRQYYYTSGEGNRLFELALGPLQLSLLAVSDKDSLAKVKELEQRHGDGWLAESGGDGSGGTISSGSGDRGMPALNNGQGDGSGFDAYDPSKIGLPDS